MARDRPSSLETRTGARNVLPSHKRVVRVGHAEAGMSKTVIKDFRRAKFRSDGTAARCAERKASIDRLKVEDCGRDAFHGSNHSCGPDREDTPDISTAP
jgi:hypothetical protein